MPQLNRQPDAERGAPDVLPPQTDAIALIRLLEEFSRGDEAEQRETFESLKRALDEDRRPGYKLFPAE
jgi:hypothetical protein